MNTTQSIFVDDSEMIKNKVRFVRCNDWNDFAKEIKKVVAVSKNKSESGEIPNRIIYRGHALKNGNFLPNLSGHSCYLLVSIKGVVNH